MSGLAEIVFRRYGPRDARELRDSVALLYRDAYARRVDAADPFYSVDAFLHRFDAYTSRDGFDLVMGFAGDTPVGQAWGWPLEAGTAWWNGLLDEVPPAFTHEDGTRTFAVSEIMVARPWTGRGLAHGLHDELLGNRRESRATLLVNPENRDAYAIYTRWGWQKAARLRPAWEGAPTYDVLMLPISPAPAGTQENPTGPPTA
ncbi:GNAT family N-acetyltransferase [Streptomonospora salina]|uniref:GNAT superfamily N-acetyltransferase n=1 Tax=Streptomonospora salina TaxID=104205 RepID=A0A841EAY9_9ACTN|nr:GNAT family N-acetyltransferase [Streptomonospora salina]MBB6000172.1 GNAT superfamily N-acetyltransferase [Streptomonospora salina]